MLKHPTMAAKTFTTFETALTTLTKNAGATVSETFEGTREYAFDDGSMLYAKGTGRNLRTWIEDC